MVSGGSGLGRKPALQLEICALPPVTLSNSAISPETFSDGRIAVRVRDGCSEGNTFTRPPREASANSTISENWSGKLTVTAENASNTIGPAPDRFGGRDFRCFSKCIGRRIYFVVAPILDRRANVRDFESGQYAGI